MSTTELPNETEIPGVANSKLPSRTASITTFYESTPPSSADLRCSTLKDQTSYERTEERHVCCICYGGLKYGELVKACKCKGSRGLAHPPCVTQWMLKGISRCIVCKEPFDRVFRPHCSRQLVEQVAYLLRLLWYIAILLWNILATVFLYLAVILVLLVLPTLLVFMITVVCVAEYFVTHEVFGVINLVLALTYCCYFVLCYSYYQILHQNGVL